MATQGVLPIKRAAEEYECTEETIKTGIKSGGVKASKRGRVTYIERASLEKFLISAAPPPRKKGAS
jgi:hypothetical protein